MTVTLDWSEIVLRLGIATVAAGAIGLDRDLHGKPIGLKTLGLVGLATSTLVLLATAHLPAGQVSDAASRIMQGILTGIGFLCAGVIVRGKHNFKVHGLTSAACAFLAACVGIVCGTGEWRIVAISMAIAFLLLAFGHHAEHFLHRALGGKTAGAAAPSPPLAAQPSEAGPHQPGR